MAHASPWRSVQARGAPPFEVVFFDMDGTLTDRISSWEWVHRRWGVDNTSSWEAFQRGDIDDLEFMRRDIALWRKAGLQNVEEVRRALDDIPLVPGARELVDALHACGTHTIIVTGGLDILAERVCRELGIRAHVGNGLATDGHGHLLEDGVLRVPVRDKGQPVKRLLAELGISQAKAAAIGNSAGDVPMFRACGFGVAFDPVDDEVRRAADVVIEEKDLRRAIPHLAR